MFPNKGTDAKPVAVNPGQYVPLTLFAGEQPDAILLPQAALAQGEVGSRVLVVDDSGKATARTVEADRAFQDQWVISKGVKLGERVVVDGVQKLRRGMMVKVRDAKPDAAKADAGSGPRDGTTAPAKASAGKS